MKRLLCALIFLSTSMLAMEAGHGVAGDTQSCGGIVYVDWAEVCLDYHVVFVRGRDVLGANWIAVYNAHTMQRIGNPVPSGYARLSFDGQRLLVIDDDDSYSMVRLYSTRTMELIGYPIPGSYARFSADSRVLSVVNKRVMTCYSTQDLRVMGTEFLSIRNLL